MKIQTEIEVDAALKASLKDGDVRLVLIVAVPYGSKGRTASYVADNFDPEAIARVQATLQSVMNGALEKAIPLAQAEAAAAHKKALELGEDV